MRWMIALLLIPTLASAQGSADLSWTPPSAFTNGDPLDPVTDLSEYRIYQGDTIIARPAPGTQSFTVNDLGYGDHELYMTAVALNGSESMMSNVEVVTVVDDRVPEPPSNFLARLIAWVKSLFGWWA